MQLAVQYLSYTLLCSALIPIRQKKNNVSSYTPNLRIIEYKGEIILALYLPLPVAFLRTLLPPPYKVSQTNNS